MGGMKRISLCLSLFKAEKSKNGTSFGCKNPMATFASACETPVVCQLVIGHDTLHSLAAWNDSPGNAVALH